MNHCISFINIIWGTTMAQLWFKVDYFHPEFIDNISVLGDMVLNTQNILLSWSFDIFSTIRIL